MNRMMLMWAVIAVCLASCGKTEPADGPAQQPAEQPADNPAEAPDDPAEAPDDPAEGTEDPAQEHTEEPTQEPAEKPQPGTYLLPVMETTDIHGHMVEKENGTVHYRLAYVAGKARDIRGRGDQYRKDRLLLLDGGDLYQGASISNLLSGWPVYISLDKMDYDAVTVGNHEFDWGIMNLVDQDATLPDYEWEGVPYDNQVPVVCANLYQNGRRLFCTRDYVIVEKSAVNTQGATVPVKIGVVGFAEDYASSIMASKFTGMGYSVKEDFGMANSLAARLESSGQCDATILLTHCAANDAAAGLGQSSVIDLVLGGHSHQTLSGTQAGIPYLQGGRYCENYAAADLRFNVDQAGAVSFAGVANLRTLPVDASLDQRPAYLDEDVRAVSDQALAAISDVLDDVIGHINVGATSYTLAGSGGRAAIISNWMCDILRRIGEADVAFVNSGGIRTYFALNGATRDITVSDVYEMFPFGNRTYVYRLTYAELLEVFKYAMTSGGQGLFSRMTGLDCYYTQYTVRSLKKDGTVIWQNNTWTGDWASRTVTLAVSEYLATSERTDYYTGMANPLIAWNQTGRLLSSGRVDNTNAVRVLREEAAQSGGLLSIDTAAHFIQQ